MSDPTLLQFRSKQPASRISDRTTLTARPFVSRFCERSAEAVKKTGVWQPSGATMSNQSEDWQRRSAKVFRRKTVMQSCMERNDHTVR